MLKILKIIRFKIFVYSLVSFLLLALGCSDKPVGYIFEPTERNQVSLALVTAEVLSELYNFTDEAAFYLDASSLTSDYGTILPSGWQDTLLFDPNTNQNLTAYTRSYLDQDFFYLVFNYREQPNAVRFPSDLVLTYAELRSFQDQISNSFYLDVSERQLLSIEYANDRTDPLNIEGTYGVSRAVRFVTEIELADGSTYLDDYYLRPFWTFKIENYSIDPTDQKSRLIIDGNFPLLDETNTFQEPHVSGEILINSDGSGTGELYFHGDLSVKMMFTGRGAGFEGYYSTSKEKFENQVRITYQDN